MVHVPRAKQWTLLRVLAREISQSKDAIDVRGKERSQGESNSVPTAAVWKLEMQSRMTEEKPRVLNIGISDARERVEGKQ